MKMVSSRQNLFQLHQEICDSGGKGLIAHQKMHNAHNFLFASNTLFYTDF